MKKIIKIVDKIKNFLFFKVPEYYLGVMFPYPSGNGLHIGHVYNYTIADSYANYLRYKGIKVFQPFGYDSFGLPAENYAKSINGDPKKITYDNINKFRNQMLKMNTNYEELLITSDKSYQKWSKWLFKKLKKYNLVYKSNSLVNYCPSCNTTLANEQVKNNHCDRCNSIVEQKELDQWFIKITNYKERLLKNLDSLDYPIKTKKMQKEWINNLKDWCISRQRKWGCPIPIKKETDTLDTFVDSSFYFLRYLDPYNPFKLLRKNRYKQMDLYIGGSEHACMHLIYARAIHMFLYDIGIVPIEEPFKKVFHQGFILNNGEKMSKSKGNIISPDKYDSDELRFYLMFLGPYDEGGSWNDKAISGIKRFKHKFIDWMRKDGNDIIDLESFKQSIFNYTELFKFNKVVSSFMILLNENKHKSLSKDIKIELLKLIKIYMPNFLI